MSVVLSALLAIAVGVLVLALACRWLGESLAHLVWAWLCLLGAGLHGQWFWLVIDLLAMVYCFHLARKYSREEAAS